MQKISGILSASARVTSVDMKDAAPVRPGTPAFGRPEGVSSLRERQVQADALTRGPEMSRDQFDLRSSKEGQQAKMVEKLAGDFFQRQMNPNKDIGGVEQITDSDSGSTIAAIVAADTASSSRPAGANYDDVGAAVKERINPDGLYPKGSFVDYEA